MQPGDYRKEQMIMRQATIEDINALIKLRLDFLEADRGTLTGDEEKLIRSQLTSYFTSQINHNFISVLAELDNKIVSTAFLAIMEKPANPSFITGKTGTILNVFTYPAYRRMGFAAKVISRLIVEAKEMGLSSIDLSSTREGKPLYERFGFLEHKSRHTPMKLQLK